MRFVRQLLYAIFIASVFVASQGRIAFADQGRVDEDGVFRFPLGNGNPTLICTPLIVCILQLQPGEIVYDRGAGDTARWIITVGVMGPDGSTELVYFKPTERGLFTDGFVSTNRRKYVFFLSSRLPENAIPPHLVYGFSYDRDVKMLTRQEAHALELTAPPASPNPQLAVNQLTTLDTGYKIVGQASFAPLSAYNDGLHTYLKMPSRQYDVPTIYAHDDASNSDTPLVVHPIVNGTFVVDGTPMKLILASTPIKTGTCDRNPRSCVIVERVRQ